MRDQDLPIGGGSSTVHRTELNKNSFDTFSLILEASENTCLERHLNWVDSKSCTPLKRDLLRERFVREERHERLRIRLRQPHQMLHASHLLKHHLDRLPDRLVYLVRRALRPPLRPPQRVPFGGLEGTTEPSAPSQRSVLKSTNRLSYGLPFPK